MPSAKVMARLTVGAFGAALAASAFNVGIAHAQQVRDSAAAGTSAHGSAHASAVNAESCNPDEPYYWYSC